MKCIICHSTDISLRRVNEQLSRGQDMILVPVDVLVCNNCGERYYDRRTMQKLEERGAARDEQGDGEKSEESSAGNPWRGGLSLGY
jgi:YgiT-type zinc finger domain-containing protein